MHGLFVRASVRKVTARTGHRVRPWRSKNVVETGGTFACVGGCQDFFGSDLGEIARGLVVFVVVLIGVAALAVGVAREGTRHLVGIAAGVLVAASLLSLVLANHYGLEAK
jgi:hypothetical protein